MVELLGEIAPDRGQIAAMFNPETAPYVRSYYLPAFEAAVRSLKREPLVVPVHSDAEIEAAVTSLGRESGGPVLMPDAFVGDHRAPIISLAGRNKVPAVSHDFELTRDVLLMSYGPNLADLYRSAARYVDRIYEAAVVKVASRGSSSSAAMLLSASRSETSASGPWSSSPRSAST
jgi:putative ABC transport system substrate-binding protein